MRGLIAKLKTELIYLFYVLDFDFEVFRTRGSGRKSGGGTRGKRFWFWIAVAFVLCLIPSPDWWLSVFGDARCLGKVFGGEHSSFWNKFINENTDLKEWGVHAFLMGCIAYYTMSLFRRSRFRAFLFCVIFVGFIAIAIEFFQGILPTSFHRGFSASDIWASLLGGILGALVRRGVVMLRHSE